MIAVPSIMRLQTHQPKNINHKPANLLINLSHFVIKIALKTHKLRVL